MGYGVLAALLGLVTFLYFHTKEEYDSEHRERLEQEGKISHLQDVRRNLYEEINKYYCQQKQDLEFVLKNEIKRAHEKGLYTRYAVDDILRMILENHCEVGIRKIQDIDFKNFEKTIKTALYADKGYLSVFQKYLNENPEFYRMDDRQRHILLTEEEYEKMCNKNYDFIFDSIEIK